MEIRLSEMKSPPGSDSDDTLTLNAPGSSGGSTGAAGIVAEAIEEEAVVVEAAGRSGAGADAAAPGAFGRGSSQPVDDKNGKSATRATKNRATESVEEVRGNIEGVLTPRQNAEEGAGHPCARIFGSSSRLRNVGRRGAACGILGS